MYVLATFISTVTARARLLASTSRTVLRVELDEAVRRSDYMLSEREVRRWRARLDELHEGDFDEEADGDLFDFLGTMSGIESASTIAILNLASLTGLAFQALPIVLTSDARDVQTLEATLMNQLGKDLEILAEPPAQVPGTKYPGLEALFGPFDPEPAESQQAPAPVVADSDKEEED
jgi:hypothetical protein